MNQKIDALYAHTKLNTERETGTPFTTPFSLNLGDDVQGETAGGELRKIGLSLDVLSKALGLPVDYMRHTYVPGDKGLPQTFEELESKLIYPLEAIVDTAPTAALDPKPLAARLITSLHDNAQMPYAGIGKLCNVDADNIANADNLTDDEAYRVCVALLLVDRELNYQRRAQ